MIIPKVISTKSNAEITSFEKITHIAAITEKKSSADCLFGVLLLHRSL